MTEDLGSTTNPLSLTGEQWVLETRSDDPASPEPDERWIRTDLNSGDREATLKCGDGTEIPLFPTGLAEDTVREALRYHVGGQTLFAPIAPESDAAFPARRIQHDGQLHAFHDRVAPGSAIPDIVAYGGSDNNTYVHDLSDGSLVQTLSESGSSVRGVALNDQYVAYGGNDNNTYVHDLSDGSLVQILY